MRRGSVEVLAIVFVAIGIIGAIISIIICNS